MSYSAQRVITYRMDILRAGAYYMTAALRPGGTVAMNAAAEIKTIMTCSVDWDDNINWLTDLLVPTVTIDGVETQIGLFVPGTVEKRYVNGAPIAHVEAYDMALYLTQNAIAERIMLEAGDKYTDVLQNLLMECGIAGAIVDSNDATLQSDRSDWDIGTRYIDITNALLAEINYDAVWIDRHGMARLQAKKAPSAIDVKRTYSAGARSLIHADCISTLDLYDAPNVFLVCVSSPDLDEPMVAMSKNDDPDSALSTIRRGREIVAPVVYLDDIASEDALQAYADHLRDTSMLASEVVSYSTAVNPDHAVGDGIAIYNGKVDGVYRETGWTITMEAGALMEHTAERMVYR